MGNDALGLLDDVEAHEGNLHRQNGSQDVERGVRDVQSVRVPSYRSTSLGNPTNQHHEDHINGNDVDDEHVASPRRHHVEIAQRTARRDEQRARIHRLHPQIEREDHRKDSDRFVIVGTAHRTRDVRWNYSHKGRGQ